MKQRGNEMKESRMRESVGSESKSESLGEEAVESVTKDLKKTHRLYSFLKIRACCLMFL